MGRIWRPLKEMQLVVGIKRLRQDVSATSSKDLESLGSSLARNPRMEYKLSDLEVFITTVDRDRNSSITSLH